VRAVRWRRSGSRRRRSCANSRRTTEPSGRLSAARGPPAWAAPPGSPRRR
jgi:hypothetical protein